MNKMKVLYISIVLSFSLMVEASAQKWLEKIGKVLDTVEKVANQLPDTGSKHQSKQGTADTDQAVTFTYGDVKVISTLPHFIIAVDDVKRTGRNKGTIFLTLTNTSSREVRIHDFQNVTKLVDSEGKIYNDYGKWELQIGNLTVRRYGTDSDYTFPPNQPVNVQFHVFDLEGNATVKSEKVGSFIKTTTRIPSVSVENMTLEPSIVFQQENIRRYYKIEINNVRIPAYVHIDRKGIKNNESVIGEDKVEIPIPAPKDTIKIIGVEKPDTVQWKAIIQDALNRQGGYVALRRGIHYTNEPTGDWRSQYRLTNLNLSSGEYAELSGILFEEVDDSLQFKDATMLKERELAIQYSSYPRKGTRCGIITFIAPEYKKDMKTGTFMGVPAYMFKANKLILEHIERMDETTINGQRAKGFILTVTDTPTPFKIAYTRAIQRANDATSQKKSEATKLSCGLVFIYNRKNKQWEAVTPIKYNPKNNKWEKWENWKRQ